MVGLFLEKLEPLAAKSLHPHANSSLHNDVPASAFETSGPMGMVFMTAAEIDRARHMEALLRLTALKLSIAMYHPHERSKKLKLRARLAPHRDELRALFIYRQEAPSQKSVSDMGRLTLPTPRGSPAEETCPPLPAQQHRTLSGDAQQTRRRRSPSPHPLFSASESSLSNGSTSNSATRPINRHQLHIPLNRARSYSPTRSSRSPTALTSPTPLTFPAPPSLTPPPSSTSAAQSNASKPRLRSKSPVAWIKSKLPRNFLDRISPVEERENWFDDLEDDFDGTLEGIMEDDAWLPVTPEGEYPPAVEVVVAVEGHEGGVGVEEAVQHEMAGLELSERERRQDEMATKAAAAAEEHDLGHDLKWRLEELIGKGVIGLVYRAVLLPPAPAPPVTVAVKHLHLPSANQHLNHRNFEKLIATLSLITHPNIISYFGSHLVGESAFLFMELCNQGTLTDWLRRNGPVRDLGLLAVWIAHVANGLWFIHRNGVVHRDVKPSNIMIRDNVLKLADFSSAKLHGLCCQKVHDTQMAGSPSYMAPEIITGGQSQSSVVGAQDMWSFGCVIYEMVTGKQPFEEVDNVWSLYFLLGQYSSLHASISATSSASASSSTATSPTSTSTSRVSKFFHKVRRSASSRRQKSTDAFEVDPISQRPSTSSSTTNTPLAISVPRTSTSSTDLGSVPTPPATPHASSSLADSLTSDHQGYFTPDPSQPLPAPTPAANALFPMHANHHPLLSRLCAEVPSVDPELLDLVAQCLTWDPETRVTAQRVLQHPFVKKWARRAVV